MCKRVVSTGDTPLPTDNLTCAAARHSTMSQLISLSVSLPSVSPSHWFETVGTQRAPSEAEAGDIRNVISDANLSLSEVEHSIDRIQEALNLFYQRRGEISEHIDVHKALLSPVRHLPNEILAEIFINCLPLFSKKDGKLSSFCRRQAPLLVCQVCSRWRAIALSTQKLWSLIQVEFGMTTVRNDVPCMSIWLERSGTHPLSFVLRERIEVLSFAGVSILDTILPFSDRWQHLEIYCHRDTLHGLSPIRDRLPLLQSISVSVFGGHEGSSWDAFELAPSLRSVDLGSGTQISYFKFPSAHLVEFCSHDATLCPAEGLEFLRHCPNLISCTFRDLLDQPIQPSTPPLQHCRLLNLSMSPESNLGGFFDCLTLPALRSVRLDPLASPVFQEMGWPGSQFLDLLERSSCTLKKFTWALNSVRIEDIVRCLEYMPDLEVLEITPNLSYSLPELLHSLTPRAPGEGKSLCPKLLVVQLSVDHTLNQEALNAFVKSRWSAEVIPGAVPIRSIRLFPTFLPWQPEKVLRHLKEFQDEGLDVSVCDSDGSWGRF